MFLFINVTQYRKLAEKRITFLNADPGSRPAWPCAGKDALRAAAQLHLSGFEEVERVVGAAHPTRGPIGDLN